MFYWIFSIAHIKCMSFVIGQAKHVCFCIVIIATPTKYKY